MTRNQHRYSRLTPALLLGTALLGHAAFAAALSDGAASTATSDHGTTASAQPPLRSRAQLDAWLKTNAGKATPLDAFSAGGRERFLRGLGFGQNGLGSLPTDDLSWELDNAQARAVLALFGEESMAAIARNYAGASRWRGGKNQPSDIDQRYTRYIVQRDALRENDALATAQALGKLYRAQFPADLFQHPEKLSDPDLLLLTRGAASAARETHAEDQIQHILGLLPVLERRGFDITPLARDTQAALLGAGQLDRARAFAATQPSLEFEPLPLVKVAPETLPAGPRWWRLSADATSMRAESADLSDTQILVLAGCHFSVDAAEDVQADPELAPVFARHAHWLGLPLGDEDVAAWKDWNRKFPNTPMHLITRRSDWPMFPSWNMPTYAVVRDGKVIDKTSGAWRNYPEARVALVAMLRRNGLMSEVSEKTAPAATAKSRE